jgi:hypothetical protein
VIHLLAQVLTAALLYLLTVFNSQCTILNDDNRGAHASTHAAVNFSTLVKRALSRRHRVTDAVAIESAWSSLVQSYTQTGKSLMLVPVTSVTALCQVNCMSHSAAQDDCELVRCKSYSLAAAEALVNSDQTASMLCSSAVPSIELTLNWPCDSVQVCYCLLQKSQQIECVKVDRIANAIHYCITRLFASLANTNRL